MSVTWNCGVCGAQGFPTSDEKCSECLSPGGAEPGARITPRMGALSLERDLKNPEWVAEMKSRSDEADAIMRARGWLPSPDARSGEPSGD